MNTNKIKILNLYAGIGGNRKLWPNDKIQVITVENVPKIAKIYQDFYPNDKVIIGDAHKYLLKHYKEFDFIWSSPPCPTHSRTNHYLNAQGVIRYPDMKLYQEIILLKHFFDGLWVIENVISYYEPLIRPYVIERHYFWSNKVLLDTNNKSTFNIVNARTSTRLDLETYKKSLEEYHGISLSNYNISSNYKRLLLRNCVNPKLALHIFNLIFKEKQVTLQ